VYLPSTGTHRRLRPGMRGLGATTLSQSQIQQMITASAQQYGVDPALALSIAQQESSFNPNAVSPINPNGTVDYGLMQINSSNLSSLGLTPTTALDPQSNINAAMQLLSTYTQQYNGDPSLIAAAYNGGPGSSTGTSYVSSVLANMSNFGSSVGQGLTDLLSSITPSDMTDTGDLTAGTLDTSTALFIGLGLLAGAFLLTEIA
jgi:soluble lytic murein transglycosylase-like protein